jgi:hypothetical protein
MPPLPTHPCPCCCWLPAVVVISFFQTWRSDAAEHVDLVVRPPLSDGPCVNALIIQAPGRRASNYLMPLSPRYYGTSTHNATVRARLNNRACNASVRSAREQAPKLQAVAMATPHEESCTQKHQLLLRLTETTSTTPLSAQEAKGKKLVRTQAHCCKHTGKGCCSSAAISGSREASGRAACPAIQNNTAARPIVLLLDRPHHSTLNPTTRPAARPKGSPNCCTAASSSHAAAAATAHAAGTGLCPPRPTCLAYCLH